MLQLSENVSIRIWGGQLVNLGRPGAATVGLCGVKSALDSAFTERSPSSHVRSMP